MLLDLDGTVADTHELMFLCYSHALATKSDRPADRTRWEAAAGLPLRDVFLHCMGEGPFEDSLLDELVITYRSHMKEIHDSAVRVYPGIPETLAALKEAGIRLAIVTTKFRWQATRHLEFLKLDHFFELMVAGDECNRMKPDPEPFQRALLALDVPPGQAVAAGDSRHDITSAKAAGVWAAAACWGTVQREYLLAAGPDVVLEKPADLLKLVYDPKVGV